MKESNYINWYTNSIKRKIRKKEYNLTLMTLCFFWWYNFLRYKAHTVAMAMQVATPAPVAITEYCQIWLVSSGIERVLKVL